MREKTDFKTPQELASYLLGHADGELLAWKEFCQYLNMSRDEKLSWAGKKLSKLFTPK